jgi:hypothetical protein
MRGHPHTTEHAPVAANSSDVDLVTDDELVLTSDAATVLARIVRARVEGACRSSVSCHTDAAHSMP